MPSQTFISGSTSDFSYLSEDSTTAALKPSDIKSQRHEDSSSGIEIIGTKSQPDKPQQKDSSVKRKALSASSGEEGCESSDTEQPPVKKLKKVTRMRVAETKTERSLRKITRSIVRLTAIVEGISDDVARLQESFDSIVTSVGGSLA